MDLLKDLIGGALGGIWGYVAAAGAALLGLLGVYLKGRSDVKRKVEAEAAKNAIKSRKEIDDALEASHAGGGSWSDRLRRNRDNRD